MEKLQQLSATVEIEKDMVSENMRMHYDPLHLKLLK